MLEEVQRRLVCSLLQLTGMDLVLNLAEFSLKTTVRSPNIMKINITHLHTALCIFMIMPYCTVRY